MLKNIIGSIVFTVAVFALVNFIGDAMVNPDTAPRSPAPLKAEIAPAPSAPQAVQQAVKEATPAPATATATSAAPVAAAVVAMVGDAGAGKKVFRRKCMGCHTMNKGDANRTGPNLWNIIGREKGAAEGYRYSKPMRAAGGVWSEADMLAFVAGPRTFMRDTKMTFAGLKKEKDRANLIAYLQTLKD